MTYSAAATLTTTPARLAALLAMLRYRRPHGSTSEHAFISRFLLPLGVDADAFGNFSLTIGDAPRLLFSCHTDSCHRTTGLQEIRIENGLASLADPESNCLGADCAAGVWLMREMILAGVPGFYVFHRGEERGGLGSRYLAETTPDVLTGIRAAIAFDRRGTGSIITHQRGTRSCSDAFARSLAAAIGLGHTPDPTGTFTDTANYVDLVGECTNISVGYDDEHTARETLDIGYLVRLRDALIAADFSTLAFSRAPGEVDAADHAFAWPAATIYRPASRKTLYDLVYDNPGGIADFLEHCGIEPEALEEYLGLDLASHSSGPPDDHAIPF